MSLFPILTIGLFLVILIVVSLIIAAVAQKLSRALKKGSSMNGASAKRWLIYRSAALPILFILPFFINHFYQFPCPNPKEFAGPCYQVGGGAFTGWLGLFAAVFGIIMLFSVRATWKRGEQRLEFAKIQLKYALVTVVITVAAYAVMFHFSQGRYLHLLDGFAPPNSDTLAKVQNHPLGVSYVPLILIPFCLLYLLAPISQWWNINRDKSRVSGIKKKKLFQ